MWRGKNDASKSKVKEAVKVKKMTGRRLSFKKCPYNADIQQSLCVHFAPGIMAWHIYVISFNSVLITECVSTVIDNYFHIINELTGSETVSKLSHVT